MTIKEIFDLDNESWVNIWPDSEKNEAFSKILLPYFSTTEQILNNQYILNLVSLFDNLFTNWIEVMKDEELVITNKDQVLNLIKNEFRRWILKNALAIKNNYESLLLAINDEFTTSRTYTTSKTDSSTSTFKEGFSGGGLSNQQGTKQSSSSTNQGNVKSEDTDKYNQNDTLRKLNYLQILKPLDFDNFFNELKEIIFITIWSE